MTSTDRIAEIEARLSALGRTAVGTKEFVVHAPTDMAALVSVVKAVRALHQPRTVYANETHCTRSPFDADHYLGRHVEDRTGFWVCLDLVLTDECNTCTDDNGATADWPCPTAAAVEKLGGA